MHVLILLHVYHISPQNDIIWRYSNAASDLSKYNRFSHAFFFDSGRSAILSRDCHHYRMYSISNIFQKMFWTISWTIRTHLQALWRQIDNWKTDLLSRYRWYETLLRKFGGWPIRSLKRRWWKGLISILFMDYFILISKERLKPPWLTIIRDVMERDMFMQILIFDGSTQRLHDLFTGAQRELTIWKRCPEHRWSSVSMVARPCPDYYTRYIH